MSDILRGSWRLLPADGHVHSEWSWDAPGGSMERTCARAVELGLPSIAFTEHADFTPWTLPGGGQAPPGDGLLIPPPLDVPGYLACLRRCRELFPDLRILSGVELSEPHWHAHRTAELIDPGDFDRILGSVHSLPASESRFLEVSDAYREWSPPEVVRAYLAEVASMIRTSDAFAVLAHIDYPARSWPVDAGPYDPTRFEDEYREALGALAGTGRALEINTRGPVHPEIVRWWREAGGDAVTFGSDAHDPDTVARDFARAGAVVEAHGFRPGRRPYDMWVAEMPG